MEAVKTSTNRVAGDKSTYAITKNAEAVLKARYLAKDDNGKPIETPAELFNRVATVIADVEKNYGLSEGAIETVKQEFYDLMVSGRFMPNSPTLMNAGRSMGMLSACFVLPVEDSIDGIFTSIKNTALIQKAGGGTGFSFANLRPKNDIVRSSGGTTSGPLSFMKVFSEATNAIQQGAFRRGANMGMMRIDHPDIVDFINVKENLTNLTNFNLSVSVTDEFMQNLKDNPNSDHVCYNPRTGEASNIPKDNGGNWSVKEIYDEIVQKAWNTGEPGIIFIDEVNRKNPTPHIGKIEATNPCGEQPLLPYESCNLGSINICKFVEKDENGIANFNWDSLKNTIHLSTRFLDNVIDANNYPIKEIEDIAKNNRKIGLGLMGFGDTLYAMGIPYNSSEGVKFAEKVMKFLNDESHAVSEKLADDRGCFPNWKGSIWEKNKRKMRNACTTTLAPTGTISIIANCSCGIEPLFSLAFHRNVLDGQRLTEVNEQFETVSKKLGIHSQKLLDRICELGSISQIDGIPEDIKKVFVTARDITPEWHVKMQAAFQKHCDSAISKTTNFPHEATIQEVSDIYVQAWEQKCKGVTVYRDGCRDNQPMALTEKKKETKKEVIPATSTLKLTKDGFVKPMRLPDILTAIRIKQMTPFGNMHVKIVVDPISGKEREVFAQLGKGGDVACSDLEAMCRLMSLYLRVEGSLNDVVKQLEGIGSSLSISTKDGRITSLADGLAKAIQKYQHAKKDSGLKALLLGESDLSQVSKGLRTMGDDMGAKETTANTAFKLKCPECAGELVMAEGCAKCHSCGFSKCS